MHAASDWFAEGERLEQGEDLSSAARAYERAIELAPYSAEARFNLGNVLRGLGRPREAVASFRAAIECDSTMAEAWYNVADVQEEAGQLDAAAESLESALRIDPGFGDAIFNLAGCLERLGRIHDARALWRRYLLLDSTSEWATFARARLAPDATRLGC